MIVTTNPRQRAYLSKSVPFLMNLQCRTVTEVIIGAVAAAAAARQIPKMLDTMPELLRYQLLQHGKATPVRQSQ
jgi:hypothetical protein